MNQAIGRSIALLCVAGTLTPALRAQATRGDWPIAGGDPGQNRWQKAETRLSPSTVPTDFKFLWKIQLGKPGDVADVYTEPLLAPRLINAQGFKDFVYWPSSTALYGVDSELGSLLWTRQYDLKRASGCAAPTLSALIEPPAVINFAARRPPGSTPPTPQPPMDPGQRRLGVAPGGGGFGLRGIYVLTSDGMLHEQVLTTGADFAPPVKFLPAAASGAESLNILGKSVYTVAAKNCAAAPNGLWSLDIGSPAYPVASIPTGKSHPLAAPAIAPDGTAFVLTGPGTAAPGIYPSSVVALGKDMKPRDWYTPTKPAGLVENATPATFPYKGRQYVIAPGAGGTFVLLDAASLGGADHHTPLSETAAFTAPTAKHPWDGFATWLDKDGTAWVFASVSAPIVTKEKSATASGPTTHGGIIAFRIDDADNKPVLNPVWISADMLNPAPPTVANGIVVALAGGNPTTHATLSVLDATTGKHLFSSADTIPTYTHLSGVAVGDGHAFFTDHTGTLYSFGIAIEH